LSAPLVPFLRRLGSSSVRTTELQARRDLRLPDDESGRYQVSKILYADDDVVVARLYTNRFDECPAEVPQGLRLNITPEELDRGEIGIGWGAIAFDAAGFAIDELILLGDEPVTDEERENAEVALDPSKLKEREGVWSRLSGLFRRRK
jgi:hypothetical protein